MIKILIGESSYEECRKQVKSGKAKGFPGSNSQCCYYFHELLGYPILFKSPQTGKPSLGKKIMFQLALKYPNNPVITLILMYRETAKESGALKFIPWKDDNNKIYEPNKHLKATDDTFKVEDSNRYSKSASSSPLAFLGGL